MSSTPTKVKAVVGVLLLSAAGVLSIKTHEGTVPVVYKDPVGILTVCTGHVSPGLKLGEKYSSARCDELLQADTADAQRAVKGAVKVPVTQEQYDALVSLVFNIGSGNFNKSTLLRKLNAGQCVAASAEFNRWVYARGVKLPGLVRRRAEESKQFLAGC